MTITHQRSDPSTAVINSATPVPPFVTAFLDRVAKASDLATTTTIDDQLQRLERNSAETNGFDTVRLALAERINGIQTDIVTSHLSAVSELIPTIGTDVKKLMEAREALAEATKARHAIAIDRPELRSSIDEQLLECRSALASTGEQVLGSLRTELAAVLPWFNDQYRHVGSYRELEMLRDSQPALRLEALQVAFPTDEEIQKITHAVHSGFQATRTRLDNEVRAEHLQSEARFAASQQIGVSHLEAFQSALHRCRTESQITSFLKLNPTARQIDTWLSKQPTAIATGVQKQRDDLVARHRVTVQRGELLADRIQNQDRTAPFGAIRFPIFVAPRAEVRPVIVPDGHGSTTGRLIYEGPGGFLAKTSKVGLPLNLDAPSVQTAIEETRSEAQSALDLRASRVPTPDPSWRRNAHVDAQLEDLARKITATTVLGGGGVILCGEAGCGKNVMIEMFASDTNRPLFTFHCNRHTEKEDLTQAVEYDAKNGTYRLSSEFLNAIQTPGAVIHLEEVNTLTPGVSKLLNGLFGYSRSIQLPYGGSVKADPSVILLGSMNPSHYLGTQPLPDEFIDRSFFVDATYAPLKVGPAGQERWTSYEAGAGRVFRKCLQSLTDSEFESAWEAVINKDGGAKEQVKHLITNEIERAITELHYLVRVADTLRSSYREVKVNNAPNGCPITFSLRGIVQTVAMMETGLPLRKALSAVAAAKTSNPNDRSIIEGLIDSVVPKNY